MKTNLIRDILCLAFTKKKISNKLIYLFKGFIFTPFLWNDLRGKKDKNRNVSEADVAGDDVYPLF